MWVGLVQKPNASALGADVERLRWGIGVARAKQIEIANATGAIYAIVAVGFTLLWQTSQTINFAQGEFVMLPAFLMLAAMHVGAPFWLAILIGFGGWLFARRWGLLGETDGTCTCDRCKMRCIMWPAVMVTVAPRQSARGKASPCTG